MSSSSLRRSIELADQTSKGRLSRTCLSILKLVSRTRSILLQIVVFLVYGAILLRVCSMLLKAFQG